MGAARSRRGGESAGTDTCMVTPGGINRGSEGGKSDRETRTSTERRHDWRARTEDGDEDPSLNQAFPTGTHTTRHNLELVERAKAKKRWDDVVAGKRGTSSLVEQ